MQRLVKKGALLLAVLGLVLGSFSQVFAQDMVLEVEPNDPCLTAQDILEFTVPLIIEGSLDTPPADPDVDFYRFSATPGTLLMADFEGQVTGKGTLADPFQGLDSSSMCRLSYKTVRPSALAYSSD